MKDIVEILVPLAGVICLFGLPVYLHYKKLFMEIQLKAGKGVESNVLAELQALKHQIAELRDTTTRYDMSFDSALQRLENRMTHMEGQVNAKPEEKVYSGRVD